MLQGRGGRKEAEWVDTDLLGHRYNLEPALVLGGQGETKKKADRSGLIGGRFHKQENLHRRHAVGEHKTSGSLHLPPRILKVQTEALTGASQMHRGLNWV